MGSEGKWREEKLWFYHSFNVCPLTGAFQLKKIWTLKSVSAIKAQRGSKWLDTAAVCLESIIHSNILLLCIDTSSFCLPRHAPRHSIKCFATVYIFFRCDYHVLLEIYCMKIQRQVSFHVVRSGGCSPLSYRWTSLNPSGSLTDGWNSCSLSFWPSQQQ